MKNEVFKISDEIDRLLTNRPLGNKIPIEIRNQINILKSKREALCNSLKKS